MRAAQLIELSEEEIKTLTRRARRAPARLMNRAKIVLMSARGEQNKSIAGVLGIDPRGKCRDGADGFIRLGLVWGN